MKTLKFEKWFEDAGPVYVIMPIWKLAEIYSLSIQMRRALENIRKEFK